MPDPRVHVQESDVRWTIWLNREKRSYQASILPPGPGWERVEVVPAEQVRVVVEVLRKYGRHLPTCDLPTRGWINGGRCDCGWEDVDPNRTR